MHICRPIIDDGSVVHLLKHYLQHTRTADASCSALSSRQVSVNEQCTNKSSGAILRYPSKVSNNGYFWPIFDYFGQCMLKHAKQKHRKYIPLGSFNSIA